MTQRFDITGFKRSPNRDDRQPGAFFKISFEYQSDAEIIYAKLAPHFKDYELELTVRRETTTAEKLAGNAAFVKDCRKWGRTGPHASMIRPAIAGHKRILAAAKKAAR